MMARVYECGYFTISSNTSFDNHKYSNPRPHEWVSKSSKEDRQSSWLSEMLLQGPLAKRAWCLQERYMSPRILHVFEGCIWIWECDSRVRPAHRRGLLFRHDIVDSNLPWRRRLINDQLSSSDLLKLWYKAVADFSHRILSYENDKLPAISGIAAKLQPRLQSRYLAGIWQKDIYGLMWVVDSQESLYGNFETVNAEFRKLYKPATKTPSSYRAPSWSWASIDSPITYLEPRIVFQKDFQLPLFHYQASFERLDIHVNEDEPFGRVKEGSRITLSGYFWHTRYSLYEYRLYFDHRPEEVLEPIYHFLLAFISFGGGGRLYHAVGLVLLQSGQNTYRRIGMFKSSLDVVRRNLTLQGILPALKELKEENASLIHSLLGEKDEIILV
jgi:hypothetical protein